MVRRITLACAAALVLALSGWAQVFAHASLTSCTIKNNDIFPLAHAPRTVIATFAEPLDPKQSWINVFEGVADHGLVNEKTRSIVNFKNPKQMTLRLPALHRERYYLVWYTHSAADGHFAAGIVYFRVT